jgi:hypothetical protein
MRLTPLAGKLISETQTPFIPGRYILEGVIILHETLHELRVSKVPGVILKLDFEKAYDSELEVYDGGTQEKEFP